MDRLDLRSAIDRLKTGWWWISDSDWRRRHTENRQRIRNFRSAQRSAVERLLKAYGSKVLAGPFAGMSFSPALLSNVYCAQVLLGTYELEIHGVLREICESTYSLIVDIGADNGYYVCGLRRSRPDIRIVAFEAALEKHTNIHALLRENTVEEATTVLGLCDPSSLQAQLDGEARPFVLCDIDGAEVELLDVDSVPALINADILVETHDGIREGITDLLIRRFTPTHDIQVLPERTRRVSDAPVGMPLSGPELIAAMDEFRGFPQAWLWMVAKSHASGNGVRQVRQATDVRTVPTSS